MIKVKNLRWSLPLAACILIFLSGIPAFAIDLNIPRMAQEAPYFDAYPDSKGIVWYRSLDYSLLPDGRMEKQTEWLILAKEGISDNWLNWVFPVEKGGSVKVVEAGIYDPVTSRLVSPVIAETEKLKDLDIKKLKFPVILDEFLIHLSVEEKIPTGCRLNDFVITGLDIPAWEQQINVRVPGETEVYYKSSGMDVPVIKTSGGSDQYRWISLGLSSWKNNSLLKQDRPFLAFSLRKGPEAFAVDIKGISSPVLPAPPDEIISGSSGKNSMDVAKNIIKKIEDSFLVIDLPYGIVRNQVPLEGPWTKWEKAFILSDWLKSAGLEVTLFWTSFSDINSDTPQTLRNFSDPVLEISPKGGKSFYYIPDQTAPLGRVPAILWGQSLYGMKEDKFIEEKVSADKLSDHRLLAKWNLKLSENGSMKGKVRINVLNGWKGLFFNDILPDEKLAEEFLARMTGARITDKISVKRITDGYSFEASIVNAPAIMNGDRALVRVPVMVIPQLRDLAGKSGPMELKFPFVIKEEFEISYPENSEIITLPAESGKIEDVVSFRESLSMNSRKRIARGSFQFQIKNENIGRENMPAYRDSLRRWVLWSDKTLPFRFKNLK